jgi:hypothetical protein
MIAIRCLLPVVFFVVAGSAGAAGSPAGATLSPPPLHVASFYVSLSVSPAPSPFPYWGSPTVGDGTQITLTATLPPANATFPNLQFSFTAELLPSGQTFALQNNGNQATWTPHKGGDYNFKVVVRRGSAEGGAAVNNFHVKPKFASTAKVYANPPAMALPGAFTISATVMPHSVMPHFPFVAVTMNRFWFGYAQQFVPYALVWQNPISTLSHTALWNPNPQLTPGLYGIEVYVQTFSNHVLIAEGFGTTSSVPADFYRGYYVVLLPPDPCPTPTPAADPTLPFGWLTPITTQNSSGQPVATPQGSAACAIAGYSINDIANNAQLRVRTIDVSCSNCHIALMAWNTGRDWFCNVLPAGFPHTQPPDNEAALYNLFADWKTRACPD